MSDISFLLAEVDRLRDAGQSFAVGTVVYIGGSTYRRAGGRMLVREDLSTWGLISGGCLEEEIAREAEHVLPTGQPALRTYDMTGPDDVLGFNTGCNGTVEVLITRDSAALKHLRASMQHRLTGVLVQSIDGPDPEGTAIWVEANDVQALADDPALFKAVGDVLETRQSVTLNLPERRLLLEYLQPPVHLVVFGTGADVYPLLEIGRTLGWKITVVGRHAQDWLKNRFSQAHDHVFLMHPESVLDVVRSDARTAAVVMNHNLDRDRVMVRELLQSSAAYIGLLGPRDRCREISEAALANCVEPSHLDRLYGPAGLDTGADSPEEIALSIATEILAVLNNRPASRLREGSGPIHVANLCTPGSQEI